MKKRILIVSLLLLLFAGVLGISFLFFHPKDEQSDTVQLSTEKADDDFSDLFRLTDSHGDALAALTVTKIEEVSDLIEKYEVTDTLYTKITATVDKDYAERISSGTVTILLLGNSENFPSREVLKEGNRYILRLEAWAHESGTVYLLNPLESTYLRIHDGMVLVRESASLPNYKPALTPDAFARQFAEYRQENPADETALQKHYKEMLSVIENYDYTKEELEYVPDQAAIDARLSHAKSLAK